MDSRSIIATTCSAVGCLVAIILFASYETVQAVPPRPLDTSSSSSHENIRIRYARAYLELAKANLDIALDVNKRIDAAYSENSVQRLRNQVEIARTMLQYELDGGKSEKLHDVHIKSLKKASELANRNLASAMVVNKRLAGTVNEREIKRLRLEAEVARLAIIRGLDPAAVGTPYAHLQWQLDQMRSELLRLQIRIDKLTESR